MHRPSRRQRLINRYGSIGRIVLLGGCAAVFLISAVMLARYGVDMARSKREAKELARLYYETEAPLQTAWSMETPAPQADETAVTEAAAETAPAQALLQAQTAMPQATGVPWVSNYPGNPYLSVSASIKKLQRQNKDIIGWLHIDQMLDEAVLQRDNEYYLRRDYQGYHNVNGALFLDEKCDLSRRPLIYMVYGHNMKTGAMFGCLRNWENKTFYHNNPFIRFDTMYEDGEYVIFSVGIMSETTLSAGLSLYYYRDGEQAREQLTDFIRALERGSMYTNHIEVDGNDQLLLLLTCSENDSERRVVAARRVREGEKAEELKKTVATNQKR